MIEKEERRKERKYKQKVNIFVENKDDLVILVKKVKVNDNKPWYTLKWKMRIVRRDGVNQEERVNTRRFKMVYVYILYSPICCPRSSRSIHRVYIETYRRGWSTQAYLHLRFEDDDSKTSPVCSATRSTILIKRSRILYLSPSLPPAVPQQPSSSRTTTILRDRVSSTFDFS